MTQRASAGSLEISSSLGSSAPSRYGLENSSIEMGSSGNQEELQTLLGGGSERFPRTATVADTNSNAKASEILLSRKIARFFSSRFSWYGRNGNIDQAWEYFERITLPRRMIDRSQGEAAAGASFSLGNGKVKYVKAPTGKQESSLYPAWTTSADDLADFGTGIAVYFETMRALVLMMLVSGLLYTPTFLYYKSEAFDDTDQSNQFLSGSMICEDTAWVPCPECILSEWEESPHRIAFSTQNNLTFVLKNTCAPLRWQEGVNHLIVVAFWIIAIVALAKHQKRMEKKYDEANLTASDFSIQVDNPPFDAADPDEWKTFFAQFGQVSYVTVAMHNEDLVDLLVKRRILLQKLGFKIKGRSDDSPLQFVPRQLAEEHPGLYKRLTRIENKCRQMLLGKFDVSAVFVTFETEACQRKALETLMVGKLHTATNNTRILRTEQLFRGNRVLDVFESVEPSAIRWQDLDETLTVKIFQRVISFSITILVIFLGFVAVRHGFEHGSTIAAYEIVLLNMLVPKVLRFVNMLESHPREGTYQASLYIKVCCFRWINTAIITMFVKPFTATIESTHGALIPSVYAVLKAEIITVPIVHMLDIMGNIKRHLLAPHSANQAAMNSYFGGAPCFLGEKYTGVTKLVFLCFFYSVIFPSSFFFGAAALAIAYWTEKFNLLRSWAPMPELGDQVAWISRHVFFPLSVLALVVMSEFYWSSYPFDNVCDSGKLAGDEGSSGYVGTHTIVPVGSDSTSLVKVEDGTLLYRYCNMDFLERVSVLFSFFQEEKDDWMTPDQIMLTYSFGMFCAITLAIMLVFFCHRAVMPQVNETIGVTYKTDEVDSGKKFGDQALIKAYVPQVRHRAFHYPLLACDVAELCPGHIGWDDPIRSHTYYSMAEDVRVLLKGRQDNQIDGPALSRVRWYNTRTPGQTM